MSFLKRLFTDDLSPIRANTPRHASTRPQQGEAIDESGARRSDATSRPGISTVVLNWNAGENDPFSVTNRAIAGHLHASGKNVEIVEISSDKWWTKLEELAPSVDFVFTWQGFGSYGTIWERLRVPLICVHGDHPSHMPQNHENESEYCFHLYTNADFARYSNRHFRRIRSATVIDIPQLHRERRLESFAGDHFVFAKNVNHPMDTEARWRERLAPWAFDVYMSAAETLQARLPAETYVEIHDVLDDFLKARNVDRLMPSADAAGYHQFHSQLDHFSRSLKSIRVVQSMRDFPLKVYGRGWERIAAEASRIHTFDAGKDMADSQALYYSRYGIVDVSPSKGLHDRTRRAMANGTSFLSSANLEDSFDDVDRFDRLFYSFHGDALKEHCTAVMHDPEGHREASRSFAHTYHNRFHFRDFANRLDALAKLVTRF